MKGDGIVSGSTASAASAENALPCTQGMPQPASAQGKDGAFPAATADWLAARHYAYLLFQRLLGAEPSRGLFAAVDLAVAREAFGIAGCAADGMAGEAGCAADGMAGEAGCAADGMAGEGPGVEAQDASLPPAFCAMLAVLEEAARLDEGEMRAWKADYTRLFVGPAALPAPPWESVYTSHERLIMQPSTLEVRTAYRECGFQPALCRHVPDDHVALELDFLAALAKNALEAQGRADAEGVREALAASSRFLEEHLGVWVGPFADEACEKGGSERYAPVVQALAAFVAADAKRLAGAGGNV